MFDTLVRLARLRAAPLGVPFLLVGLASALGADTTPVRSPEKTAPAAVAPPLVDGAPTAERPWLRIPFEERGENRRRRAVPPLDEAVSREGEIIRERTAREWRLLTYPSDRIPPMPWTRARDWVRRHVPDAAPWTLEGVPLRGVGTAAEGFAPTINAWTWFGPQPLDSVGTTNNAWRYGIVAGRTGPSALASDPVSPNVAFAGFVAGGLWRTDDIGSPVVEWTPLWDDEEMVTQSVGAITIDPNDHQTIWVGTGDWPAADQHSEGLMRSTDGGVTWTQVGASIFTPYSPTHPATGNRWSSQNVKTIAVDPKDSSKVLVGTRYDLYLSHDGGATWSICGFGNHYTNPSVTGGPTDAINRISDLWLDDRGADTVVYVAVGYPVSSANGNNGVYRFTMPSSGCPSWPGDFTTLFSGFPASTGTANGSLTGRIELAGAIGPDSHLTLYAQVGEATGNLEAEGTYVLRPDLGSTTWTKLASSSKGNYTTCTGASSTTGQDWYDLLLAVDPTDDKTVYVGHVDLFKATVNSGYTGFTANPTNLTNVYASSCAPHGTVHPDQHAFEFLAGSGGQQWLLGNDGGVYLNEDRGATGAWMQLNDTIGTIQFYAGQIGADFAGGGMSDGRQWLFGGSQDNGSSSWDSSESARQWTARSLGGDGFFTSFDPIAGTETTGWWLTEYVYGDMACSVDSGADGPFGTSSCGPAWGTGSTDWSTPFVLDQLHCTDTQCRNFLTAGQQAWAAGALGASAPSWVRTATTNLTKCTLGCGEAAITANFAPSEPKAAMLGTSDGKAWWTETLYTGANCTQVAANTSSFACTPNSSAVWRDVDPTNAVLPNRAILGVAVDPTDHTLGYVAVGGFDENTPSTPGHLFAVDWNGSSFTVTDKTGNLPNVPAASVAVNPHLPDMVFVGTHYGFYVTDDITASPPVWQRYQYGLPNTVIRHLAIDRGPTGDPVHGTTLAAFTYGRGTYALKLPTSGTLCVHPDAPTGISATATAPNEITLTWDAAAGVTWNVYRSLDGFAFALQTSGVATNGWVDTDVSGGTSYYYRVAAEDGCESPTSEIASELATGVCTLPPLFTGLGAVVAQPGATCSLRLEWPEATSRCGGGVTYNIYRDTSAGVVPGPGTIVAANVDPGTACSGGDCAWLDSGVAPSTTYHYLVRAEDDAIAAEDANTVEKSGFGVGPLAVDQELFADDFDSSSTGTLGGWLVRNFGASGTSSWKGVEQCGAQSGSNELRFGGLDGGGPACSKNYNVDNLHGIEPEAGAGVTVPYGSANVRLSFWHRWEFEVSSPFCGGPCDGGFLAIDANGDLNYALVPSSAFVANPYNGTVAAGYPAFGDSQATYLQSGIDLDAACDADTGSFDGCGGRTVRVSWIGYSDVSVNRDGWFVDSVRLAADVPGACVTSGPQTLDVTLAGTGSGTVTSAPPGIDCGVDCDETWAYGTDVNLSAAADVGSEFSGWSGEGCSGTGTCDVTMTAPRSVTATFSPETWTLTVSVAGSGTAGSLPAGIDCGSDCSENYPYGQVVTLTQVADANWHFTGWTGDADCTDGSVTMTADVSCQANFARDTHTLTLTVDGNGSVTTAGSLIDCPGDCSEDYPFDAVVALTPTADPSWHFTGWTGDADCSDGSVSMTTDVACQANFAIDTWTLTVSISGNGSVSTSGGEIGCPGDCSETLSDGSMLTLNPLADSNWHFTGWTGDADCSDGSVTFTADLSCQANFEKDTHTLTVSVDGNGTVQSSPAGIDCGVDCTQDYAFDQSVTLTPTADASWHFTGWTGDADCSDGSVLMSTDVGCQASFAKDTHTLTVSIDGNGSVQSSPAGIDCGVDCTEDYPFDQTVTLTPTADTDWHFTGWTGDADCSDGSVSMTTDVSCQANFAKDTNTLTVSVDGSGSVTTAGNLIDCPGDCSEDYPFDAVVVLTPAADTNWHFTGWTGDADCSDGSVTMSTDVGCQANFAKDTHTLTVTVDGNGTAQSSPAGIDCGVDCTEDYPFDQTVTLTPTADTNWHFTGWNGDADCSDGSVSMSTDVSCQANFSIDTRTLTVEVTGDGSVGSDPAGVACPGDCTESFAHGTVVDLAATPGAGRKLDSWSVDCSGTGACQVTMTADRSVGATFVVDPVVFLDGFESGDTSAWSAVTP